jgi:peptidoglycan/xylan/chitin deacetylase (PgdA/CDA1 family)
MEFVREHKKGISLIAILVLFIVTVTIMFVNRSSYAFREPFDLDTMYIPDVPVVTRANNEYFDGKKLVAVTFDDGPNYGTTDLLIDELAKRDAKVSFFMVGNRVEKYPELVKKVYEAGHTIGNHSYSHKSFNKQKADSYLYEINHTNQLIKNITGQDVIFLRPPYGSYKKSTLENVAMQFVLWSIDTVDWQSRNADMIYDEMIKNVKDGDIILLHDLYPTTIEGALRGIDYLLNNGFAVVSLDEMYRLRGLTPQANTSIRHLYLPEVPITEESNAQ